ncbi:hexokinase-domain-containing protein [Fimicolochytrium jonesii]|uniref:hexokinase-domain-containing protein n=1 Tax=Fimicolochytrium jonesii TaxID=1396493 RepID=UPI0022FDB8D1|nr:hexokinase-domain-containing protein [Fimicolochytrium jonesii]KAI8826230.1 hexokinase-domain-containing protein [Fimicolochytrium jonesii]
MTQLWSADNRVPLFVFGLTTGIALTAAVQYLVTSISGTPLNLRAAADEDRDHRSSSSSSSQQGPVAQRKNVETATQRLERQFTISTAMLHNLVKAFIRDMERGLKRDNAVMKMIPSYVIRRPTGDETGTYLALDLGGSNFRVCECTLAGKGQVRIRQKKFVVSEELKTGTATALFDYFAECVSSTMDGFGLDKQAGTKLGFTFSFPVQQQALNRGTLYHWTKGFTAEGVVGQDVVGLLDAALRRKGLKIDVTALVNDTVGTLISHAYLDTATTMGVILGTGTNAAYVERLENIPKWTGPKCPTNEMIINMEWGAWGQDGIILPTTDYDVKVDRASPNPQKQSYEKMISGLYLGELTRYIIVDLISTGELFAGRRCEALEVQHSFDTANMSRIERDHSMELTDTRSILEDLYAVKKTTLADRRLVKRICELIGTRAARMAAVGIASVVTKTNKLAGTTVAVDGSVFEHYPHFANRMRDALRELLGINAEGIVLAQARDGSGQGAALIAALADHGEEKLQ